MFTSPNMLSQFSGLVHRSKYQKQMQPTKLHIFPSWLPNTQYKSMHYRIWKLWGVTGTSKNGSKSQKLHKIPCVFKPSQQTTLSWRNPTYHFFLRTGQESGAFVLQQSPIDTQTTNMNVKPKKNKWSINTLDSWDLCIPHHQSCGSPRPSDLDSI